MNKLHTGYVYIMTNHSRTLYIGVTNNLERRLLQHKNGTGAIFAAKYRIKQLVYYVTYSDIRDAIAREKQLKRWRRSKKIALIEAQNPEWADLSRSWYT